MTSVAWEPLRSTFKAGWQIFRHELLYVFWALMEVALITPVFLAITPWTALWSPGAAALWLLLVMLIPFNLSRLTSVLQVSVERQQILMALGLLVMLAVSWRVILYSPSGLFDFSWLAAIAGHIGDGADPRWPRELALFVVTALMWWRGIALAGRGVDYRNAGLRMRAGILLAVFLVAGLAGSQLEWSVTPFVLLFLFTSLVSIVLTRVEQLELSRSGRSFPVGPGWLLTIVFVAGMVAFASGIIAGFASGQSIGVVLGLFEPLWVALRFALASIVSTMGLLLAPLLMLLITIFQWVFSLFGDATASGLDSLQESLQQMQQAPVEEMVESTGTSGTEYGQLLTGLTMLFVVLLVALALGRLYRMSRPAVEVQRQTVNPFDRADSPKRPGLRQRLLNRLNVFRRWQAAASIRQTYREMCAAAAEKGFPRAENETAYEYLPTLAKAWPGMPEETEVITEAYNRAHYGELPDTEAELQQILSAWQRLSAADKDPNSGA